MNPRLQQLVQKIDKLTLRERIFIFVTAALILILAVNWLVLDPQFMKQKKLADQIRQDQASLAAIETGIQQIIKSREIDPDAANRARLQSLNKQYGQIQNDLLDMQKGLVTPERMASLLEDILKRNGNLRLISLKTLPVSTIGEARQNAQKSAGNATAQAKKDAASSTDDKSAMGTIYRHGVELTLQGNYLDMVAYMADLESMPWQLFWGSAKLEAGEYPNSTLTLTLFTLSLDKKWLNL